MSNDFQAYNLCKLAAGVDEAGRGPLAGPVFAAAVILNPEQPINGLRDSKRLSARRRQQLAEQIQTEATDWCIGVADVVEIDTLNILQASLLAMKRALEGLAVSPEYIWVDGLHCPNFPSPMEAVVRGDSLIPAISAASILAKVARDAEMCRYDTLYPGYGLAQHKGYPTAMHLQVLHEKGPLPIHRHSFKPVRESLAHQHHPLKPSKQSDQ